MQALRPGSVGLPMVLGILLGTTWGCKQEVSGTSRAHEAGGPTGPVAASPAPFAAGTAIPRTTQSPQGTPFVSRPSTTESTESLGSTESTGSTGTRDASTPPSVGTKTQCGKASYYGRELAGNATASGEPFDPGALTAAHRTLPLGTIATVVSRANPSRTVQVRINDRGPYAHGRIIDLSAAAFARLASTTAGVAEVCVHSD